MNNEIKNITEEGRKKRTFDLEERLIDFSIKVIDVVESLPNTRTGNHLANQLIRSGTAPALIYGEAQSAESRNDFIHKMKVALKELRESLIILKIIHKKNLIHSKGFVEEVKKECNELVSIFVKSIETAQKNSNGKS